MRPQQTALIFPALLALVVCSTTAVGQDHEDELINFPPDHQLNALEGASRSLEIPPHLRDPAFDRYVDLKLVGQAWDDLDATLMTDVALQLAEGERVLLRPHKALPAASCFDLALRIASEDRDAEALARLERYFDKQGGEMKQKVALAVKLASNERAADPADSISADTSVERFAALQLYRNAMQRSRITGDTESVEQLREFLHDLDIGRDDGDALAKLSAASRGGDGEDTPQRDPAIDVLNQLSDISRGGLFGGAVDPFNRNNVTGYKVETGFRPPNHPDFKESDDSARTWQNEGGGPALKYYPIAPGAVIYPNGKVYTKSGRYLGQATIGRNSKGIRFYRLQTSNGLLIRRFQPWNGRLEQYTRRIGGGGFTN